VTKYKEKIQVKNAWTAINKKTQVKDAWTAISKGL